MPATFKENLEGDLENIIKGDFSETANITFKDLSTQAVQVIFDQSSLDTDLNTGAEVIVNQPRILLNKPDLSGLLEEGCTLEINSINYTVKEIEEYEKNYMFAYLYIT